MKKRAEILVVHHNEARRSTAPRRLHQAGHAPVEAASRAAEALPESERLRVLAAATFEGVAISEEGRLVDVNEQFSRLLGYSREELLGRDIGSLVPVEDRERVILNIRENRESQVEHRMARRDGSLITVEAHGRTVLQAGRAVRYTAVRDITERKRAEAESLRQKESFRRLAEQCPDVIARFDRQLRHRYVNPVIEQMRGFKPEQFLGRTNEELGLPADLCAQWNDMLHRVFTTGEKVAFEFAFSAFDRRTHYYAMTIVPEFDSEGRVETVLGIAHDVTIRKKAEAALRQVQDDLVQANAGLEQTVQARTAKLRERVADLERYSYSIAHDLRAPLRTMWTFSQILLESYAQELAPQAQDYLHRIEAGAERLDRLIEDVLNYSRVAHATVPAEAVDLDALVRQIVGQHPCFQPSQQIQVEIASPLLPVKGNVALLTQCLSNLLCNAVKFVAPGVTPHIKVRTEANHDVVRLWVEDNGIGIAPEHRERIFDIFERVHQPDRYEGTGIGLSIVRKAVERMGGRVDVESEPGKGSRFWIDLQGVGPELPGQ